MARAIVLFGHGSRDPLWRLPMETVAARLRSLQPGVPVRCAYLELDEPDLGTGRHAREDLPALVRQLQLLCPGVRFVLQQPVGEDSRVLDLIAKIALE